MFSSLAPCGLTGRLAADTLTLTPTLNATAHASPLPGSGEGGGERDERVFSSFSSFSPLARPGERGNRVTRHSVWGVRVNGPSATTTTGSRRWPQDRKVFDALALLYWHRGLDISRSMCAGQQAAAAPLWPLD